MPKALGSLLDYIRDPNNRKPNLAVVQQFFRDAAAGIEVFAHHGFIHRDIKPGKVWEIEN
jgi:serine/threonine protein kinase